MKEDKDFKEGKEVGVWIVYDLEANRKVQELLMNSKYQLTFYPSLKTLRKHIK